MTGSSRPSDDFARRWQTHLAALHALDLEAVEYAWRRYENLPATAHQFQRTAAYEEAMRHERRALRSGRAASAAAA